MIMTGKATGNTASGNPATGQRILIVEDDPLVARALALRLAAMGYAIAGPVANAGDAVALAASELPDLVLMDVVLAGDEVAAVADGEGGLLLYSAVARDARGAPAYLGELPPAKGGGPFAFGSSLAAVPGWVYLNDPGAGLRVIDISDPAHARPVACLRPAR